MALMAGEIQSRKTKVMHFLEKKINSGFTYRIICSKLTVNYTGMRTLCYGTVKKSDQ